MRQFTLIFAAVFVGLGGYASPRQQAMPSKPTGGTAGINPDSGQLVNNVWWSKGGLDFAGKPPQVLSGQTFKARLDFTGKALSIGSLGHVNTPEGMHFEIRGGFIDNCCYDDCEKINFEITLIGRPFNDATYCSLVTHKVSGVGRLNLMPKLGRANAGEGADPGICETSNLFRTRKAFEIVRGCGSSGKSARFDITSIIVRITRKKGCGVWLPRSIDFSLYGGFMATVPLAPAPDGSLTAEAAPVLRANHPPEAGETWRVGLECPGASTHFLLFGSGNSFRGPGLELMGYGCVGVVADPGRRILASRTLGNAGRADVDLRLPPSLSGLPIVLQGACLGTREPRFSNALHVEIEESDMW